jgi:hypothetical protein
VHYAWSCLELTCPTLIGVSFSPFLSPPFSSVTVTPSLGAIFGAETKSEIARLQLTDWVDAGQYTALQRHHLHTVHWRSMQASDKTRGGAMLCVCGHRRRSAVDRREEQTIICRLPQYCLRVSSWQL